MTISLIGAAPAAQGAPRANVAPQCAHGGWRVGTRRNGPNHQRSAAPETDKKKKTPPETDRRAVAKMSPRGFKRIAGCSFEEKLYRFFDF